MRLWPSISVFSSFGGDFLDGTEVGGRAWDRSMLLWGLTLGVVTDFFEMLPHGQPAAGWNYPTFTSPDVKAVVWLMTKGLRKRNLEKMQLGSMARALNEREQAQREAEEDVKNSIVLVQGHSGKRGKEPRASAVGTLLEGYYDVVRTAVWVTLFGRTIVTGVVLGVVWWKYRL